MSVILQVAEILAPVFAIVLVGYVYARINQPNMQVANRMNMQLLVPALIFSVMADQGFEIAQYVGLGAAAAGVVLISGCVGYCLAKVLGFRWRTLVPPMMFVNWGNLGIPLLLFTFGGDALNAAIVLFIVGNILHFTVGVTLMSGRFRALDFVKTPVIIAVILGCFISLTDTSVPAWVVKPLSMIGQAAIPMMLLALGVRLHQVCWNDLSMSFVVAIACPLVGVLAAWFLGYALELNSLQAKQLLIFGALPPAVMNFMFAEQYNLEPEKMASIVMISNLAAVPVYFVLLSFIV